jgi:hypothetical protein
LSLLTNGRVVLVEQNINMHRQRPAELGVQRA